MIELGVVDQICLPDSCVRVIRQFLPNFIGIRSAIGRFDLEIRSSDSGMNAISLFDRCRRQSLRRKWNSLEVGRVTAYQQRPRKGGIVMLRQGASLQAR